MTKENESRWRYEKRLLLLHWKLLSRSVGRSEYINQPILLSSSYTIFISLRWIRAPSSPWVSVFFISVALLQHHGFSYKRSVTPPIRFYPIMPSHLFFGKNFKKCLPKPSKHGCLVRLNLHFKWTIATVWCHCRYVRSFTVVGYFWSVWFESNWTSLWHWWWRIAGRFTFENQTRVVMIVRFLRWTALLSHSAAAITARWTT